MKFSHVAFAAGAAMAAALSVPSQAAVTTFNFTGTIGSSYNDAGTDTYVGDSFSGQFTYDTDAAPTSTFGIQNLYDDAVTINVTSPLGSASGNGYISVLHASDSRNYDLVDLVAFTSGAFSTVSLETALPLTPVGSPLPTNFDGRTFSFGANGATSGFSGTAMISRAPAAVPEPASWAMMIGGVGFAGGMMRRRPRAVLATA